MKGVDGKMSMVWIKDEHYDGSETEDGDRKSQTLEFR